LGDVEERHRKKAKVARERELKSGEWKRRGGVCGTIVK